ncbi:hypothetical protein EV127DRAFT_433733 [Xylaria flabelliformis]|nr:hypothetical protein EV127DRAFT_433733 [Xylaria flabelliformis]
MIISWAKQLLRTCLNKDTVTNERDEYEDEEEEGPVDIWLKDPKQLLIYLYQDLTRVSHVVSQDFVLHTFHDPSHPLNGIPAARAHMESLLASKVIVDVGSITITYGFGVVLGRLWVPSPRKKGRSFYATFCDVWRFDGEGRPCEHWECLGTDLQVWTNWWKKAQRRR